VRRVITKLSNTTSVEIEPIPITLPQRSSKRLSLK
jgi:hypothetical protein